MSMSDLERALDLIGQHAEEASFIGPRTELLVRTAEKALGLRLPPTYRHFVGALGAGSFGAAEIYGVIDTDFELSSVPDAIWATLRARDEHELPADLVMLGRAPDEVICLQILASGEEGPVLSMNLGEDPARIGTQRLAPDFGAYFLGLVEEELEGVR
ncbi:SMI1/KNR4 family protein [Chondromyces crocatus]|uniref:Knr4/Smi1-like domain-containing protein n=1 Tax=Chondromyces crocatus TaxID=52 RepID=A0A0K1EQE6_CHOCO|nr:SMI1/KNR4 family protein [Chondromyces crocatus]AKT42882.1 uncharacterized protein CMC5_071100 [Chondromyces crocatus]